MIEIGQNLMNVIMAVIITGGPLGLLCYLIYRTTK